MKQYFVILISLLIFSCTTDNKSSSTKPDDNLVNENPKFVGERIDGPANIRDSINGNLIFELFENVQVEVTDFKNKWCQVGVLTPIKQE
jgi:hypothetical protein